MKYQQKFKVEKCICKKTEKHSDVTVTYIFKIYFEQAKKIIKEMLYNSYNCT